MKRLIYTTGMYVPDEDDTTQAKLYRKYNIKELFECQLAWGPNTLEIHANASPAGRKLTVYSIYYIERDGKKIKANREQLEFICNLFDLPLKPLKNNK